MTLAEKIAAARAQLLAEKDGLTALTAKDNPDESDLLQIEERTTRINQIVKDLGTYESAEAALAANAQPVMLPGQTLLPAVQRSTSPTIIVPGSRSPAFVRSAYLQRNAPSGFDILVRNALAVFESHATHDTIENVLERRYPGQMELYETAKLLTWMVGKAATPPAMTNVEGWAAELVREGYGAFMDALLPESIVPRLDMQRYEFDGYGKINIPSRSTGAFDDPNLSAAFRAEGAPIRVGRTTLVSKPLTPKSMGVIGTFTKELLRRSTPNIEDAIRRWMLEDTAIRLDRTFLDTVAGTAIRPAGLRNGVVAPNTAASTGNTAQNIQDDLLGRLSQLAVHHMGRRPTWIMNTARAWAVAFARTPTGDPAFPDMSKESGSGSIAGVPVVTSTTVPPDVVLLVDAAELAFAGGAPTFEGTDVATIHEESGDPNTDMVTGGAVLPIVDGATADPVRSLYQTHSAALKAVWEIDWTVVRPGAVQVITGVAWGQPITP